MGSYEVTLTSPRTLDPEFARNEKIVFINVDQDAILYLRVKYQHVLKKFPNPSDHEAGCNFALLFRILL